QIYTMHKGEEKFFEKMKEMHKKFGDRKRQQSKGTSPKGKHEKKHRQDPRPSDIPSPNEF
ncbi:MAG: hypothetical protein K2G13_02320, partial [Muribaculaceae bacterium]|nr:hypothetical protein [Muribaculaceae bacterium]